MDGEASLVFDDVLRQRNEESCAFILDGGGTCGAPVRPGSPYCAEHHALCHVPEGSQREKQRLRETETLANAVGGRRGRSARMPPDTFLRRLEKMVRGSARPKCSRIVQGAGGEP